VAATFSEHPTPQQFDDVAMPIAEDNLLSVIL
jgi:hypothetical protein